MWSRASEPTASAQASRLLEEIVTATQANLTSSSGTVITGTVDTPSLRERLGKMGGGDAQKVPLCTLSCERFSIISKRLVAGI